ncbi:hypothetical protein F4780DRAFT_7501 [Xylariomycetidae sp. FL0641]|nr:hypothetical protein F4780DRAFT_7501 [Xylariomycetidae sp. FL0641]
MGAKDVRPPNGTCFACLYFNAPPIRAGAANACCEPQTPPTPCTCKHARACAGTHCLSCAGVRAPGLAPHATALTRPWHRVWPRPGSVLSPGSRQLTEARLIFPSPSRTMNPGDDVYWPHGRHSNETVACGEVAGDLQPIPAAKAEGEQSSGKVGRHGHLGSGKGVGVLALHRAKQYPRARASKFGQQPCFPYRDAIFPLCG